MLKRLFAFFALAAFVFSAAAASDYITLLHFPDGSTEVCPTNSYNIDFTLLDVQVVTCYTDSIYKDGFEGHTLIERDR